MFQLCCSNVRRHWSIDSKPVRSCETWEERHIAHDMTWRSQIAVNGFTLNYTDNFVWTKVSMKLLKWSTTILVLNLKKTNKKNIYSKQDEDKDSLNWRISAIHFRRQRQLAFKMMTNKTRPWLGTSALENCLHCRRWRRTWKGCDIRIGYTFCSRETWMTAWAWLLC